MKTTFIPALILYLGTVCLMGAIVLICLKVIQPIMYPTYGEIVYIDPQNNVVTFQEPNGNTWSFESDDDWRVNDKVAVIMSDNRTEEITDDEIKVVRLMES